MNNLETGMANIFLIGFMGTGKSAISAYIADNFGLELIEMDETIEAREKMSISDIFDRHGEEYFRNLETNLLKEIADKGGAVVSCGGGAPLREENVNIMKNGGKVILLSAEPETIYERVKSSQNRPLLKNNMNVEYIKEMLDKRNDKYKNAADYIVKTDGRSKKEIAEEIIGKLV